MDARKGNLIGKSLWLQQPIQTQHNEPRVRQSALEGQVGGEVTAFPGQIPPTPRPVVVGL